MHRKQASVLSISFNSVKKCMPVGSIHPKILVQVTTYLLLLATNPVRKISFPPNSLSLLRMCHSSDQVLTQEWEIMLSFHPCYLCNPVIREWFNVGNDLTTNYYLYLVGLTKLYNGESVKTITWHKILTHPIIIGCRRETEYEFWCQVVGFYILR